MITIIITIISQNPPNSSCAYVCLILGWHSACRTLPHHNVQFHCRPSHDQGNQGNHLNNKGRLRPGQQRHGILLRRIRLHKWLVASTPDPPVQASEITHSSSAKPTHSSRPQISPPSHCQHSGSPSVYGQLSRHQWLDSGVILHSKLVFKSTYDCHVCRCHFLLSLGCLSTRAKTEES